MQVSSSSYRACLALFHVNTHIYSDLADKALSTLVVYCVPSSLPSS